MAPEITTDDTRRGRGRPRQFDEDEVLDKLVSLFWERGFEAASLNDMVDAAGLNKSSLYNTFGTKEEVFAAVLQRYMEFREQMITSTLDESLGFDVLAEFFAMQRREIEGPTGCMGCLAVNAQTELGQRGDMLGSVAVDYRATLREGLRPALERAARDGVIDGELIDTYLETLIGLTVALSVSARGGVGAAELRRQIDSAERLTQTWRLD